MQHHHHHKKHKVTVYKWLNGILEFEDHVVETFDHALDFIERTLCHSFKIFDCELTLVHAGCGDQDEDDTYA